MLVRHRSPGCHERQKHLVSQLESPEKRHPSSRTSTYLIHSVHTVSSFYLWGLSQTSITKLPQMAEAPHSTVRKPRYPSSCIRTYVFDTLALFSPWQPGRLPTLCVNDDLTCKFCTGEANLLTPQPSSLCIPIIQAPFFSSGIIAPHHSDFYMVVDIKVKWVVLGWCAQHLWVGGCVKKMPDFYSAYTVVPSKKKKICGSLENPRHYYVAAKCNTSHME